MAVSNYAGIQREKNSDGKGQVHSKIATAIGDIQEQVDEGQTGFLTPPSDAAAMAARIKQLLDDRKLRWHLGKKASEIARRRYDLQHQVDVYLEWYQEI